MLGVHPGQSGILVRLEVLRLGLLASGHAAAAAGVRAGDAAAAAEFTLRDASACCSCISEERAGQRAQKVPRKCLGGQEVGN